MKKILLVISFVFLSSNVQSNMFDKLKDLSPVIDVVMKDKEKKEREEEEKKIKIEEEEREKQKDIERQEKEKQKVLGHEKKLQKFYSLFTNTGTNLKTETNITYDDFGDEQKDVSTYFVVDDQKYFVSVSCIGINDGLNRFPFRIFTEFPQRLDYNVDKGSYGFGSIRLSYKLESGLKSSYVHLWRLMDFMNKEYTGISSQKLGKFYISGGVEEDTNPLNINFKEKVESNSNGQISILIPKLSSGNYSLKFNPFQNTWLDYYQENCKDS